MQKPNVEAEVYNNNKKYDLEKKKLKILIGFHSANKIKTTRVGGKEREKKIQRIYKINENIRIINVFLKSLLSESFPSLGVTVHLTSLGCPPTL